MPFHEILVEQTKREQEQLLTIPFVRRALGGDISLDTYVAFLTQAYHHVKHTVPLLMATGSRLPRRHAWLLEALCEYIDEEKGHDEWILDDIRACGGDADAARDGAPDLACELMVAYAYDVVQRRDPLGFFGMVHVLEGTSVRAASQAAEKLQVRLGLPARAFTYLRSHGQLDQEHVGFFASLMDRVDDPEDQRWVLHCATRFFHLYGEIFRGLSLESREDTA
jgi:pyrroloquinoline quinone (PQQ) biosynthesis protein C